MKLQKSLDLSILIPSYQVWKVVLELGFLPCLNSKKIEYCERLTVSKASALNSQLIVKREREKKRVSHPIVGERLERYEMRAKTFASMQPRIDFKQMFQNFPVYSSPLLSRKRKVENPEKKFIFLLFFHLWCVWERMKKTGTRRKRGKKKGREWNRKGKGERYPMPLY